jgi:hypothetical protein
MRWPSGPLEIARREKGKDFSPQTRDTLQRWHDPASLDLLKGTRINCLLLSWAAGLPQDAEQQRTLAPLMECGRQAGLFFVAWIDGAPDKAAAIASARAAGCAAAAVEAYEGRTDLPLIAWGTRSKAPWDSAAPVIAVSENVWPCIARGAAGFRDTTAGATGMPWVDSNGWFLQMARARMRAENIWLLYDPLGGNTIEISESYRIAVADCLAYGGRWVIALDDRLRSGMVSKDPSATETWESIAGAVEFFEEHKDWRRYRPEGVVGVLSDFSGHNEDLSQEFLNLLFRRMLPYRVLDKSRVSNVAFDGLKEIVYLDEDALDDDLRQKTLAFVRNGGVLLAGSNWKSEGPVIPDAANPRFEVHRVGKGRLAVSKEEAIDPYLVAADAHLLLSHANDLVRFYNAGASTALYTTLPEGGRSLLQLVDYTTARKSGNEITVWLRRPYRSARLWQMGADSPLVLKKAPEVNGMEFYLPPIKSFAGLELE